LAITLSEERGVRFLHFGTPWIQGAMRIARPWALELEYTRDLMAPLLLRPADWPRSVLQAGLGAGSVTKFLHRYRPEARLTVVEIDPAVLATAHQYFRLPDEGRNLRVILGDAADHMASKDARHDFIVLDGYDDHGRAGMLDSVPFYANCRRRLARGGLLSVNLLTRTRGVKASVDRLREAFDGNVLVLPPCKAGNTVAIAAGEPEEESFDALGTAAERLKRESGLDLQPLIARLRVTHRGRMISLS
jgi:spermidine synthase